MSSCKVNQCLVQACVVPLANTFERLLYKWQNFLGLVGVGLLLFVEVEFTIKLGIVHQEIQHFGDLRKRFYAWLQKFANKVAVEILQVATVNPRLCVVSKGIGCHFLDVEGVQPSEFCWVEDGWALVDTRDIELLLEFLETHLFAVVLWRPTKKCNVVDDCILQKALFQKIFVTCIAIALTKFVLRVLHDGWHVDVDGSFPTERIVQKVVLWCGGKVLDTAHNAVDTHQMVVDYVCKVVGRHTVRLDENLIFQFGVFDSYVAIHFVVVGCATLRWHVLADNVLVATSKALCNFVLT